MAGELTEQQYPFTRDGHRKLMARANDYRRRMKYAFACFFDEVRRSRTELAQIRDDASQALGSAAASGNGEALELTLKKFQQLVQELGRNCECPVCYEEVQAAEMNPQHKQFMKILHCGHILCGGCAFNMKQRPSQTCPICRADIGSQLASAQAPMEDAVSQLRPKRDVADLQIAQASVHEGASASTVREGTFVTRYRGQCYLCDASWATGATVAKHRRVETKVVCVECAEKPMPCTICARDASDTDVLKNGKAELKRFFCRPCVQQKHEAGDAKGIVGATQFLKRAR